MPQRGCGSSPPAPSSDRAPTNRARRHSQHRRSSGPQCPMHATPQPPPCARGLHRNTPPRE
eukprot:6815162-Alexandrium_andersonii.AAC.1